MVKIEIDILMEYIDDIPSEVEIIRFTKADGTEIELRHGPHFGRIQVNGVEAFYGADCDAEEEFEALAGFHPSRLTAIWE